MGEFMERAYRAWRFMLDWGVGYFAAAVMLGTTLLTIAEVARRYLFGTVFHWGQDAVTYLMAGAIFLFFAVTQMRRSHLAVTALMDWLKASGRLRMVLALRVLTSLLAVCFFIPFMYMGLPIAERSMQIGRMTQSMVLPLWPFYYALIAGFAMMAVTSLFHLYQDVQALRGKRVFASGEAEENLEV